MEQPEILSEEERIIEFSCSSEAPYERMGYVEILSHEPGAINLARLNDGAALLFNHNWDELLGVITEVVIDAEQKKLRVKAKFAQSEDGLESLQMVKDGILTKVSIGYLPKDYTQEGETPEGLPVYRVINWEPYEVSLVTVPADITVGIGKSAEPETTKENLLTPSERTIIIMENPSTQEIQKAERERVLVIWR